MSLSRSARFPMFLAALEWGVAVVCALFGRWSQAGAALFLMGVLALISVTIHVIQKHRERKSNGRYRKAFEAHRVGAGGSTGRSGAGARGGTVGTSAGMSDNPYQHGSPGWVAWESLMGRGPTSAGLLAHLNPSPHVHVALPASRPTGDFDGTAAEFAAGVVTGTRSFSVDKLGRLRGVTYPSVWVPGENEAKCLVVEDSAVLDPHYYMVSARPTRTRIRESSRPSHGLTECGHGFYGYYEGSNDFYEAGRVMGVVEAYGETIVGTRGFRASKARIVALHIPADVAVGKRRLITRNYPEIPVFDSFDAMISEFPPDDAGNGVSPATDPDFWTRQVES